MQIAIVISNIESIYYVLFLFYNITIKNKNRHYAAGCDYLTDSSGASVLLAAIT